ncbi:RICIN domain-containing protein [Embleya sp. NPDC020630]|uniref:RICIN domain-containing protein n=1 Tax=Embleya sp. NPDC020630 TaxID=3363979 RepID=UPI00379C4C11
MIGITMSKLKKLSAVAGIVTVAATGLVSGASSASAVNASFTLRPASANGMCLDVVGGQVMQWTCDGTSTQQWYTGRDAHNHETLRNVGTGGQCLDVPGGNTNQGTSLIVYSCNNGDNQVWHRADTQYGSSFQNYPGSSYVLDLAGGSTQSGALAIIWPWNGHPNQQWQRV